MDKRQIGYWIVTLVFCFAMAGSGSMNLLRVEAMKEGLNGLGYPDYLMTILGVAKILGVIALLMPGATLLKEWAYAGFTFDLLGASASHAFAGHTIPEIVAPLIILGLAIGSYLLRPSHRRLPLAPVPSS